MVRIVLNLEHVSFSSSVLIFPSYYLTMNFALAPLSCRRNHNPHICLHQIVQLFRSGSCARLAIGSHNERVHATLDDCVHANTGNHPHVPPAIWNSWCSAGLRANSNRSLPTCD